VIKLLSISLTWACNFQCRTCNLWKVDNPPFLDIDRLFHGLEGSFFDRLEYINWFGGEPFLHPGLERAVRMARDRFPDARERAVVSNGWRIVPALEKLAKVDPDLLVCLSLDGFAPIHDRRRGVPGSYDEVLRALLCVRELFTKKPRLSVTLVPGEVQGLAQVAQIADYYDCEIALRPAVSGSYFRARMDTGWSAAQIDELEILLSRLPKRARGNLEFTAAIPEFLRTGSHRPCQAKRLSGVVEPDCTFRICHSHPGGLPIEKVSSRWEAMVRGAEAEDCFKNECFIDGPYSLSYLSREHAPWLWS